MCRLALTAPEIKRLNPTHDEPLLNFAFKFLQHYNSAYENTHIQNEGSGNRRLLRPDWEGEMIHASDSEEDSGSDSDSDSGRDKDADPKEDDSKPKSQSPFAGTGVDIMVDAGMQGTSGGEAWAYTRPA